MDVQVKSKSGDVFKVDLKALLLEMWHGTKHVGFMAKMYPHNKLEPHMVEEIDAKAHFILHRDKARPPANIDYLGGKPYKLDIHTSRPLEKSDFALYERDSYHLFEDVLDGLRSSGELKPL